MRATGDFAREPGALARTYNGSGDATGLRASGLAAPDQIEKVIEETVAHEH